jgi:hypothetical protein
MTYSMMALDTKCCNAVCSLCFIVMLDVIMLNVIMPNVKMLNAIILNVILLNVIMLNVIMLIIIMLSVDILYIFLLRSLFWMSLCWYVECRVALAFYMSGSRLKYTLTEICFACLTSRSVCHHESSSIHNIYYRKKIIMTKTFFAKNFACLQPILKTVFHCQRTNRLECLSRVSILIKLVCLFKCKWLHDKLSLSQCL